MEHPEEQPHRRALIELLDRDGRVARSVDVFRWPLTLGRALDNDVVLDDPYVAARHAVLQADGLGQVTLTVGDSINGVRLGPARHAAGARVTLPAAGAQLQLGGVKLRLRLPAEALAAEWPLPAMAGAALATPLMAGGLMLLLALASHWLALDPGADATAWLPVIVGLPLALAAWCGLWALVSKLFQHRFDFLGHLRIVLPWLLAIEGAGMLLPLLGSALAWPWLWRLGAPVQALLGLLLLRAHLMHLLPLASRTITTVLAGAALVGSTIQLILSQRATDRYSRPAYMSTLPLPAMRLSVTAAPSTLVQEMDPLAERLAQRVRRARAEEDRDGESSD